MRHFCVVPGCPHPGIHAISLRFRRPDSGAVIAPNTQAYLCDDHAQAGCEMDIVFRPKTSGLAEIFTWAEDGGESGHVQKSVTVIKPKATEPRGADRGAGRQVIRPVD
jgi:hypothetical protein